jgi:hypothetical protein
MKEYNIGDKVYWAVYDRKDTIKPCPVCFGKKVVIVILGNDEKVETPCNYCEKGFESSTGYVKEYEWVSKVELVGITAKEVKENSEGRFIEYRYGHYCLDSKDIFDTPEQAEIRVAEKIKEKEIEENQRYQSIKNNKLMSLSWSIGYHQKRVRDAEKEIKYHSEKVKIVKALNTNNDDKKGENK